MKARGRRMKMTRRRGKTQTWGRASEA